VRRTKDGPDDSGEESVMKRFLGMAGLLVLLATGPAEAQPLTRPINPYTRPPVSPYLNLLRGGNPAINYFGIVRPELEGIQMTQQLGQLNPYGPVPPVAPTGVLPVTGHVATFGNFSHYYYQNLGQTTPLGGRTLASTPYTSAPIAPYGPFGGVTGFGAIRR
jgi:hypothetical protein